MKKIINDKEYNVLSKEDHPQPVQNFHSFDEWLRFGRHINGQFKEQAEERIPDWILNQLK